MSEWLDFGFRIATYAACLATWILLLIAQLRKAFKEARSKNTEKVMNINKEKQKKEVLAGLYGRGNGKASDAYGYIFQAHVHADGKG